ncbi:ribosome biogenesis GTPase YlqF [Hydrogenophaga sp.]|uniref:ribosome biogenesis GTPase YlqF n=1 Tax=Hydrogenophaga sp. TaxID=1904254 RepID=UPI00199F089A|nr:ribosome biogenesis GTPase YlqF [Hydrogenophaga sp.]MBD3892539.1 ribosome biogenesis GTPase YlqF [Hydrogenophaga sp.]
MSIQWFPGHMHLTRKAITERVKDIDVVIEMLDARLPGSSANPLLAELTSGRPTLKLLNKQDLADSVRTKLWLAHFNAMPRTQAMASDANVAAPARMLVAACSALAPLRGTAVKPMRVLICGVPNVGKSTLINTLAGRRAAKTGDEAGMTRREQRIVLADHFYLFDTPGMLWPRIGVPESGSNLAASGAVGRNAYDEQEVALELLARIKQPYAALLLARYRLGLLPEQVADLGEQDLLRAIARQRGALTAGARIDWQKAAEIVLSDFRSHQIGCMTLETPQQFAHWTDAALQADAQRQARQQQRRSKLR